RVPGGAQERRRRSAEHRTPAWRGHHRRPVPQGVRRRHAVGSPRHRGRRVLRQGAAVRGEGWGGVRRPGPPRLRHGGRAGAEEALVSGIDLHAHTTASDGTYTPEDLVGEAVRRGLSVLAITDHDSTEAVGPAMAAPRAARLEIVPGVALNPEEGGAEVHVLGFFLDHEATWLRDLMREFREDRAARVHRIAERLAGLGLPIDPAEVLALVREGSAGRPHVAQVMVRKGYVASVKEAFDRYLRAGGPAYVSHRRLTVEEACDLIHRAGR